MAPIPMPLSICNSLLTLQTPSDPSHLRRLLSVVSAHSGVLVWCRDRQEYLRVKERADLTEAGAELMKKIVEIREGVDRKHVLQSHSRYEKYFTKGFFRKITEFFW